MGQFKMSRTEFEIFMQNISNALDYYDYENVWERRSLFALANGDKIQMRIPEFTVAHLLGVKTDYLISTGIFKEKDSYSLIRKLCDNEFSVFNKINDGIISFDKLFSEHAQKKAESFIENTKSNIYNLQFACKYDKTKAYLQGENGYDFDYVLSKQNKYGEIFLVGLVKDPTLGSNVYVPRSNQYYQNSSEATDKINHIINNQTITFATGLNIAGYKNFTLPPDVKQSKLANLKKLSLNTGAVVDVTGDYGWALGKHQDNLSTGAILNNSYSDIISSCMHSLQLITPEKFGINSFDSMSPNLVNVIMAYNDAITSSSISETANTSVLGTYSETIQELYDLRAKCNEQKERISSLEISNTNLQNDNQRLETENNGYAKTIEGIGNLLQKHK